MKKGTLFPLYAIKTYRGRKRFSATDS